MCDLESQPAQLQHMKYRTVVPILEDLVSIILMHLSSKM